MKYLVSHQGQESGPISLDEIVQMVRDKKIELFDYIFDESKQDWVLLMEHGDLAQKLKSNKPSRPPQMAPQIPAQSPNQAAAPAPVQKTGTGTTLEKPITMGAPDTAHNIGEWYVLKGENKFGPFSYSDVVKMLQQKVVFPFDFIWHTALDSWRRVADIEDFKEENIRKLFTTGGTKKKEVFFERKFKRHKFAGRVIVHDNLSVWKGEGFEISKGGVGITMNNSVVVPGQQVHVHFNGHGDFPSFNALCEVVSKKFVSDTTPVQYGLRFVTMSQEVQDEFYKKVA